MNRHELAALVRGAIATTAGATILFAIGSWIGWLSVLAIAALAFADFIWCALQLPERWRPW